MRPTTILYTVLLFAAPAFTLPLRLNAIESLISRQLDTDVITIAPTIDTPPKMGIDSLEKVDFV